MTSHPDDFSQLERTLKLFHPKKAWRTTKHILIRSIPDIEGFCCLRSSLSPSPSLPLFHFFSIFRCTVDDATYIPPSKKVADNISPITRDENDLVLMDSPTNNNIQKAFVIQLFFICSSA